MIVFQFGNFRSSANICRTRSACNAANCGDTGSPDLGARAENWIKRESGQAGSVGIPRLTYANTATPPLRHPAESFPLLTESSILYTHLGNRYEQTERPRARHPGSAPPENLGAGALARLGHQPPPEIHLRRRAAGQRRIPLPCIAQVGAGRLDHGRVEADGE